ncbi:hypothetical protein M1328_03640 [Patescibacteria group bacterium]|nr:hypothetical protein [Patescibacteria group bacterium]
MTAILFLISFLTRLIFLYHGFPSITHDEADYFINSYLLAKSGTDILGNRLFLTSGILNATSAIPVYIGSIIFLFLGKSIIISRLPFALLNSFTPVVFYLILKKLTNNKTFSAIGFIVFNFSPWFSYLSAQSAFDSPISLLFYLLAFYVLLTNIKPIKKYLLFLALSFLSFNSYMGIKTSFPFLIFTALLTESIYFKKKIYFRQIAKKIAVSLMVFAVFFMMVEIAPGSWQFQSRLKEKLLPLNSKILSGRVLTERSITNQQSVVKNLIANKLTAFSSLFFEQYIDAFNPYFVFVKGDQHVIYGTNYIGLFYLFDLFFLVAGFYFADEVLKSKKSIVVPFFLIFVFAAIPLGLTIDTPNISIRGYPLIIAYVFFISVGVFQIGRIIFKTERKTLLAIVAIYLVSFIFFFTLFQVIIKNASADQWHIMEKVLSAKLHNLAAKDPNQKIIVYVNEPKETLLLYLFYEENDAGVIRKSLSNDNYSVGNLEFSSHCPQAKIKNTFQILHSQRCPVNTKVFTPEVLVPPVNNLSPAYFLLK